MKRVSTRAYSRLTCNILLLAAAANAQSGSTAQLHVTLDSPQARAGAVRLGGIARGAGLFHDGGDAIGTAVQNAGGVDVKFVSAGGKRPVLTVNFERSGEEETAPISIRNVVPGGGMLPANAVVTLLGAGFRPDTRVKLEGLAEPQVSYVSPAELQFALPADTRMDSLRITAANPDEAAAEYVSYLRGVPQGESAEPLIARTIPLFSNKTAMSAVLPAQVLTRINSDYVLGLALQNPGLASAEIAVQLASGESVRIALPAGTRLSRTLGVLFGGNALTHGAVVVKSSQPIQVLGLLADRRGGTVLPVALAVQ
jgi:hypothetical protein